MVKTITKVGNSHGVVFDAALMDLAHLKLGDQANVEVHKGGTITTPPQRPLPSPEEVGGRGLFVVFVPQSPVHR